MRNMKTITDVEEIEEMRDLFICSRSRANKTYHKRRADTLCRSISEEKLSFMDGTELGSLSMQIEDGKTKRKVRRIVEKRVCKEYWKGRKNSDTVGNKHRAASRKDVSRITRKIFGGPVEGFHYLAA